MSRFSELHGALGATIALVRATEWELTGQVAQTRVSRALTRLHHHLHVAAHPSDHSAFVARSLGLHYCARSSELVLAVLCEYLRISDVSGRERGRWLARLGEAALEQAYRTEESEAWLQRRIEAQQRAYAGDR
ncbi:hypothetical protein D3875_07345 [Deinococcus cavernae]|uniref:Uncharacterized protein n=1 Tax=Deinococcus cavernae TaxID=2320857 RepID=A0A418V5N1_9DEIO|nr:hypothetical protein [Deinococcus cavernae]RJF71413.1 hypothetical protein D3875_07345 [Deinococcus cavernae]